MQIYFNEKVDTTEAFISELSQLMSRTKIEISQDIQNKGGQYEVGNYPPSLPIYRWMYEIMYSSSNADHVFNKDFITM